MQLFHEAIIFHSRELKIVPQPNNLQHKEFKEFKFVNTLPASLWHTLCTLTN